MNMRLNKKTNDDKSNKKNEKSISLNYRKHKVNSNKNISNIYYRCKSSKRSIIKIDQLTNTQLQLLNIDYEQNRKIEKLIELKNKVNRRKVIL